LGRIIFLKFFLEMLLKMPFSSATTGRDFFEITPQNANPIGYHLEKHFEKIVTEVCIKNAVSLATI